MFWMRNTQKTIDQPSLDVVESIATIFSCLRDSTEISQVLMLLLIMLPGTIKIIE